MYTRDIFATLVILICLLISSVTVCQSASANPRTDGFTGLSLDGGPSSNTTGILEFELGYDFALKRRRTVGIKTSVRFASIESQGATASLGAGVGYRWY